MHVFIEQLSDKTQSQHAKNNKQVTEEQIVNVQADEFKLRQPRVFAW